MEQMSAGTFSFGTIVIHPFLAAERCTNCTNSFPSTMKKVVLSPHRLFSLTGRGANSVALVKSNRAPSEVLYHWWITWHMSLGHFQYISSSLWALQAINTNKRHKGTTAEFTKLEYETATRRVQSVLFYMPLYHPAVIPATFA